MGTAAFRQRLNGDVPCGNYGDNDDTLGAPAPKAPRVDSSGRKLTLSPSGGIRASQRTPSEELSPFCQLPCDRPLRCSRRASRQ